MQDDTQPVAASKKLFWAGWIMSALAGATFLFSAVMKLVKPPEVAEGFAHLELPESLALGLGILELACAVIYLIPRTVVLGAILLTGYLGGAILTHLRIGEAFVSPLVVGVLVWGGIYLREPRLRMLVPWRR